MDKGTETVNNTLSSENHAGVMAIIRVSWMESYERAGFTPRTFHAPFKEGRQ